MYLARVTLHLAVWLMVMTATCLCAHVDVSNPQVVTRREEGRFLHVSVDTWPKIMPIGSTAVNGPFQLCLFSNTTSCYCEDRLRDPAAITTTTATATAAAPDAMLVSLPLPRECLPKETSEPFWFHVRVYPHGIHLPLPVPVPVPLPLP
jgi:hypothetical protein